jgi:hypothetical protein
MSRKTPDFQPSLILLDVLTGAFRASGTTFEGWCKDNGLSPMNVRNAALGQSRSDSAKKVLEQAIDAAGREFVLKIYRDRVLDHAAQLRKGAA